MVLAMIGVVLGVSALSFVSLRAPREADRIQELRRARTEAIQTGRPAVTGGNHTLRATHVRFLPDGRAVGPGADPLTGAPLDSAR